MDISVFGLSTVAAITVLCYLVGAGVKTTRWTTSTYRSSAAALALCLAL